MKVDEPGGADCHWNVGAGLPFAPTVKVAVVGAVAVARGKQIDPTLHPKEGEPAPNALPKESAK